MTTVTAIELGALQPAPVSLLNHVDPISGADEVPPAPETDAHESMSRKRTFVVISSVTFITGIGSLLSGVTTVCLPTLVEDLQIAPGLLLW
jgi:hypothetical protein